MSRDIFVQDIPVGISTVDQIPDDWQPQPLPFGHAQVVDAVRELAPEADTTDPECVHVTLSGVDVEVNVTDQLPLESFALHVRATDRSAADAFIGGLLDRLGARAFDSESRQRQLSVLTSYRSSTDPVTRIRADRRRRDALIAA